MPIAEVLCLMLSIEFRWKNEANNIANDEYRMLCFEYIFYKYENVAVTIMAVYFLLMAIAKRVMISDC
jgi:hypothetical protein